MAMTHVIALGRSARWQQRIDTLPPLAWLALHAAALWPHWRWAAARVADGSDDPLGLAALAALLFFVAAGASRMRAAPRAGWLLAALGLSVAATAAGFAAPPLIGALLAALALACSLQAFMPAGHALVPFAGLAVLALPLLSSMQFYAGYPLRVLTAEVSAWLLQIAGMEALRAGSAMQVNGLWVIVDAPCSGVQMVWMAYFCAFAMAAFDELRDGVMLRRLPAVGALVLAGNVLRNTVLVALEPQGEAVGFINNQWVHQGVGLAVLGLVCAGTVRVIHGGRRAGP